MRGFANKVPLDGDTITVLDDQRVQHKIRLAGIDAPEKSQAFGQRSKAFLSSLVFSKPVVVETQKTDRYGRTVGKVLVGDRDASLALVVAGLAWHYKKYEAEQSTSDRMIYASAEQDARVARQGLWADPSAMPPWEWRAQKRSKSEHRGSEPIKPRSRVFAWRAHAGSCATFRGYRTTARQCPMRHQAQAIRARRRRP